MHTSNSGESSHCSSDDTSNFFGFLIQNNLPEIPQDKKNVAEVSVLLGKENWMTFYRKLHKRSSLQPCQLNIKYATLSKITF